MTSGNRSIDCWLKAGSADVNVETSGDSVVQYVIARCRGEEIKIRQVIEALTAHLERREQ